jgi:ribosome biogenesis GTPase
MNELARKKCVPCEGGVAPLTAEQIRPLLKGLDGWALDGGMIAKTFKFKNYYETMAFVNAAAWVSHREDHHPDLPEHAAALASLKNYIKVGYPVITMSAKSDISPLKPHLEGQLTLLVGQSGMGKSKTVNALVMNDVARVGELSANLGSGTQTTTFSRMYRLDRDTAIIDTPGFQSFGLFHLTEDQIGEAIREFRPFLGSCKFNDCAHRTEPGCAIIEAAAKGKITAERLSFYQVLIEQHRELHEQHPDWSKD